MRSPVVDCRVIRSAGLLLFLTLAGAASAFPVTDERPLLPGQAFALRIEAGEVDVAAGEAGKVQAEAELAPGQRLVWREGPERQVLVLDDGERLTPRPTRLRLRVPPDADLVLRIGDASLRLAGVGGQRLRVEGGNGDVRVESPAREVSVETLRGAIEATVDAGSIRSRTVGGAQRIAASGAGSLDAASVGGSIDASLAAGGAVRLASASGRLSLRAGSASGLDARLDTLSGAIALELPPGEGVALEIAQARGEAQVPAVFTAGPDGRLRLGEGGGRVRLSSFAGPVAVRLSPAQP